MIIRDATDADAGFLTQIYNHEVLNGTALWTDILVDEGNRLAFLAERRAAGFPVFIGEVDGVAAGYSTYGTFRGKDGYDLTVEHSVYLLPEYQGQGLGPKLMQAIIDRAREQGLHAMIASVEAGNTGSVLLHERMGFVEVARMPQVGKKFGRWLDMLFLQLTLDDRPAP